jgi:hypothetical protein
LTVYPEEKIKKILGEIRFEGHFHTCFDSLKMTQLQELLHWIKDCRDYKIPPIQSKKDRKMIGFVKRFGSNIRAVLIKEKEGYFLSLFLDKHKYYEAEMERAGF